MCLGKFPSFFCIIRVEQYQQRLVLVVQVLRQLPQHERDAWAPQSKAEIMTKTAKRFDGGEAVLAGGVAGGAVGAMEPFIQLSQSQGKKSRLQGRIVCNEH